MKEIIFIKDYVKESGKVVRAGVISLCQDKEADDFIQKGFAKVNEAEQLEKSVPLKTKRKK